MSDILPVNSSDDKQVGEQLPITVLAQLDDVIVLQTAAFNPTGVVLTDSDTYNDANHEHMFAEGQSSYGALNLGLHVQDNAEQVLGNRMRLLSAINTQLNASSNKKVANAIQRLHWVNQVHGKQIHDIDNTALSMQAVNADAMVSHQVNIGLAIMTADCVPIVLYQPTTGQIAAIHAGWQGLACGVIKETAQRFDLAAPIKAWIGVCISQQHYEVDTAVAEQLLTGCIDHHLLTADAIEHFNDRFALAVDADKLKLDLPKIAAAQLQYLNITVANTLPIDCSYDDSRYYSYRRQTHRRQAATGRMALIIARSGAIINSPISSESIKANVFQST